MQLSLGSTAASQALNLIAKYCGIDATTSSGDPSLVHNGKTFVQFNTIVRGVVRSSKPELLGSTPLEQAEVSQWSTFASSLLAGGAIGTSLQTANDFLTTRSFFVSNTLTVADLLMYCALYASVSKVIKKPTAELCNLLRWFDQVQHSVRALGPATAAACPELLVLDLTALDDLCVPEPAAAAAAASPKANKAEGKKAGKGEKPAACPAAAAGKEAAKGGEKKEKKVKKEKKEKPAPAAAPADDGLLVRKLDLKVGLITKAWKHPDAEKLYCEEIDCGEGSPRMICSGLVPHYTEEQMQNRRVVVLCNLKPRNMVGFKSHGMVLCATGKDGVCRFVEPPVGAAAGERVEFDGVIEEAMTPAQVQKKKVFETVQPQFSTTADGTATFNGIPFMTTAGPCVSPEVCNGTIS